ncbi:hypothetical protein A3D62_01930 [Candidatus Kaiserbacteria bacterium RIFCSPHIGHO2_02_FULL_49_11]|uniref:Transcriptional regulator n=1 Tax=Candidatus Kaiserbacteria bacterium RIFCSPHIGHO2_02_FULL_49_11 TaxID=1798489 RepID=A0A1F6CZ43_9BACT|nr:MAG: hypothetical protein A3D62_01930 [Candidatus Kaiserbacteria bacterium RIFCSPHIGHO2_02_FULL_49_11]
MSGHNKWSKIKNKKAASDAQKSKIFGKLGKLLATESKLAKGDVNTPRMRTVIEKAKQANMPQDNINRAVQKGKTDTASLEEVLYEAYGPGGVAIIIEGLTDSRNRTAQEIKHLLSKHDTALAAPGAAVWAFEKTADGFEPKNTVPLLDFEREKLSNLVEAILDHDDVQEVYTNEE